MDTIIIAKIKKGRDNEIWITLSTYTGQLRVDIREYFIPEGKSDFSPTKKGVSVPIERISELEDMLEAIDTETVDSAETLEISKGWEIRGALREYEKHRYMELRNYILNKQKEWIPAKGVTFKPEIFEQLKASVRRAASQQMEI